MVQFTWVMISLRHKIFYSLVNLFGKGEDFSSSYEGIYFRVVSSLVATALNPKVLPSDLWPKNLKEIYKRKYRNGWHGLSLFSHMRRYGAGLSRSSGVTRGGTGQKPRREIKAHPRSLDIARDGSRGMVSKVEPQAPKNIFAVVTREENGTSGFPSRLRLAKADAAKRAGTTLV
jgi:hypothetical protein